MDIHQREIYNFCGALRDASDMSNGDFPKGHHETLKSPPNIQAPH